MYVSRSPISRLMAQLAIVLLCCFMSAFSGKADGMDLVRTEFWVSPNGNDASPGTRSEPFLTLERARDAIRSLNTTRRGEIVVYLHGGTYRLERTFVLDWRDSGRNGHSVTYRAAPNEHPVISGSLRVQNWSLYDAGRGIYRAYVGQHESRQLYVDGQRGIRARTGQYPAGFRPSFPAGIEFIPTDLNPGRWRDPATWTDPENIEAVIVTQWRMMRVPLESVIPYPDYTPLPFLLPEFKTGLITLKQPGWSNANIFLSSLTFEPGPWSFWQVTWFENAYEFLDEPGEWYLDKAAGWLYYIPRLGENLATADVELPILEVLMEGQGELDRPIANVSFKDLTFSHATWLGPSSENGYVSDQSGFHLVGPDHKPNIIGHDPNVTRTAGNVQFRYAHKVEFRRNIFEHLGGAGLDFETGSQDNIIADNQFRDISSAAIQLGGVSTIDHHPERPEQVARDNVISNNLIRQTGREYVDAAGIFAGFTRGTLISHNTIIDVPWSGIAMGWGWGLLDQGMFPGLPGAYRGEWGTYTTPTPNSGNRILDNRFQQFLNVVWDGGAIYTTGQQGTSMHDALLIEGNVAYGKRRAGGGNTFYTDGGSRYVVLKRNVSFDNPQGVTDFGPPSNPADPLPYPPYSILNNIPYGSDSGGCVTYGDISFIGNYWSSNLFFDICPYSEGGITYPVNLTYRNNQIIQGAEDVPRSILNAAGTHNGYLPGKYE